MKIKTSEILEALIIIRYGENPSDEERETIKIEKDESKKMKKMIRCRMTERNKKKYAHDKIKLMIKCMNKIVLDNEVEKINEYHEPSETYKSVTERIRVNIGDENKPVYEIQYYMYLGYVGICDGYHIFKYGYTNMVDKRIEDHIEDYGMFQLVLFKYFYPKNLGRYIRNKVKEDLYVTEIEIRMNEYLLENKIARIPFMNKSRRREIFGIKDLSELENIIDGYKNVINDCEHFHVKELKKRVEKLEKKVANHEKIVKENRSLEKEIRILNKKQELHDEDTNLDELAELKVDYEDKVVECKKNDKDSKKYAKLYVEKDLEALKYKAAIENMEKKERALKNKMARMSALLRSNGISQRKKSKSSEKRGRPKKNDDKELLLD